MDEAQNKKGESNMKPKNFSKKLAFSKKTISHLNNGTMGNARGGATYTCNSICCHYTDALQDPTCGLDCLSVNPDLCPQ
jgi:hypothetical protein